MTNLTISSPKTSDFLRNTRRYGPKTLYMLVFTAHSVYGYEFSSVWEGVFTVYVWDYSISIKHVCDGRLMRSPCFLCVSVYTPNKHLNAWTSLYETWYAYHGTWALLNGVFHKFFPSVCVSLIVARQRLGKNVTAATNTLTTIEELLEASSSVRSVSY
jgi:hypothetical protein